MKVVVVLGRQDNGVGDNIVDVGGAGGAGIAKVVDGDGGRFKREDFLAVVVGVAFEVDEDVDS